MTVVTLLVGGLFMIYGRLTAGELLAFSSLAGTLAKDVYKRQGGALPGIRIGQSRRGDVR